MSSPVFCKENVDIVDLEEVVKDPGRALVGDRWVNCNKGDSQSPKCRGRYVAQEVNPGGEADPSFDSATPTVRSKKGSVQPMGQGAYPRWPAASIAFPGRQES